MMSRIAIIVLLAGPCLGQDAARIDQIVQSYWPTINSWGQRSWRAALMSCLARAMAQPTWNGTSPIRRTPKFRLGSITKQFTAASILLLEERGKLRVNDPVKKYIPDAPSAWDKITIYHVLTHTSGIPSFTGFADYQKLEPFASTPAELVARFREKPLDFQPGEQWSYSNSGFVLLGYLIERVSGETYETFVRDNIFTPLGMKHSGYDSNSAIIVHRASGYISGKNGFEHAGFIHMSIPFAAGALYSTTEDLLKWQQGLFGGKVLRRPEVSVAWLGN